jgi:hypothetical protein
MIPATPLSSPGLVYGTLSQNKMHRPRETPEMGFEGVHDIGPTYITETGSHFCLISAGCGNLAIRDFWFWFTKHEGKFNHLQRKSVND